jgi:preprotein translocase subunit SecA
MGLKPGEVIDSPMVTRVIAKTQKKVEARNFDIRKHLLEYDEVMDKQRKFIYGQRQEALEYKGLRDKALGMFEEVLDPVVERCAGDKDKPVDFAELQKWLRHRCGDELDLAGFEQAPREGLFRWLMERVEKLHDARAAEYGADWDAMQRFLVLDTIDNKWKDHLYAMEVLKQGIGLRGYAQVDPKNEYKKEGFEKFQLLKAEIADHVTGFLYKREATDTIREVVTGRMRPAAPPPPQPQQVPMPRTPEELQQLFQQLVAAGRIPPEVLDRMQKGERFVLRVTPQGLVLQPAGPDGPPPDGGAPPAGPEDTAAAATEPPPPPPPAAPSPAPSAPPAPPAPPAARLAPARPMAPPPPPRPSAQPKPGRNDLCPCGSGLKYKKCCAPAFD